jgi:pimeloyl-ACP methyl ester carboxylesterase
VDIYWESTGTGDAVLLIGGLGLGGGAWWRTVPVLARRFRVLTYDHRGVGRSQSRAQTYTTAEMADDAASVLDEAGVESAHVYGFSLGGMVAQQLALRHPERVRSLVLAATQPGGTHAVAPDREVQAFFRRRPDLPTEEAAWAAVVYNYSARCRRELGARIAEDIAAKLAQPFAPSAYRAQLRAAAGHDCFRRLGALAAPTLVVHGTEDRMIPVRNAELIAGAVPGARLQTVEAGHLFTTEEPGVDETVAAFFAAAA